MRFRYADTGIWYVFITLLRCRLRCWRRHNPIETQIVSLRHVVLQIRVFWAVRDCFCQINGVVVFTIVKMILRELFFQIVQKHICNIWRELFTCSFIVLRHIPQNLSWPRRLLSDLWQEQNLNFMSLQCAFATCISYWFPIFKLSNYWNGVGILCGLCQQCNIWLSIQPERLSI